MLHDFFINSTSFLQSPEWEVFQKSLGRKTWRTGAHLIIQHVLFRRFHYAYCPHPLNIGDDFLREWEGVAAEAHTVFLKIDPQSAPNITYRKSRIVNSLQPSRTAVLDLQKSENELLGAMHEKTRYNIRLAERHGVQVTSHESHNTANKLGTFLGLLKETATRDGFRPHERGHYEKLLRVRSENFSNELFFAEYGGKILAAALVNFYGHSKVVTYLHGASSREYRETMAPHLLHWRIIEEAKRRGFRYYDLWGVDEKKWPGVTRFKQGFGGEVLQYPPSIDIIYRPLWYAGYRAAKRFLA